MTISDVSTTSARIHLDRFVANVRAVQAHVAPTEVMVVVKADAYGHGMVACARAAREAGVGWLGVATVGEALALRESGDRGRLMAWMFGEDTDLAEPVAADVDLGIHRVEHVGRVAAAAATAGRTARVHLKIDTGLCRNGATPEQWDELCLAALEAERAGALEVVGVWTHLASSDDLSLPATARQLDVFDTAYARARELGLKPPIRHVANSAAALQVPRARYEMVRLGVAAYGIDPADGDIARRQGVELQPVMELRAQLVNVKDVPAGAEVSYGGTWTAPTATRLGLVPLGYADGIPRHASGTAQMLVGGRVVPLRGRVCMDQMIVELGPDAADVPGDEVCLFGAPGAPRAEEWARWSDTIGYEVVTRIGPRVPRVHLSATSHEESRP
ncbi:alanine racemase [Mariniluteicoccus endophyticus]